jgi:Histidine kinase
VTAAMQHAVSLRSAMRPILARPLVSGVPLLKGLTWLRVGVTLLFAAAFALSSTSGYHFLCTATPSCGEQSFIERYLDNLRDFCLSLFPPMLTLTIADNLRLRSPRRKAALILAFAIGVAIAWLLQLIVEFGNPLAIPLSDIFGSIPNGLIVPLVNGGMIAIVYFKRRRDLEIAAALDAAGLARVELQRRTLESNLQAMQARVEPRFLLGTLRSIGSLYDSDPVAADRMLDHLIVYLRAALPQMRSTSSKVGVELDLVRAYLGIQQMRAGAPLDVAIDAPKELLDSPFPPMVLLPLVEEALHRDRAGKAEDRGLQITAGVGDSKLKITLADSGLPDYCQGALDNMRARLAALYGNNATLASRRRECGCAELEMSIPYENTGTSDV